MDEEPKERPHGRLQVIKYVIVLKKKLTLSGVVSARTPKGIIRSARPIVVDDCFLSEAHVHERES